MSIQRKVLRKTPNTEKALEILLSQSAQKSAGKLSPVISPLKNKNDKLKDKEHAIPDSIHKFTPKDPKTLPKSSLLTSKDTTTSNAPEYDETFASRLKANAIANMLASPIRMDKLRWTTFPRDLLIPFGFEEDQDPENIPFSSSSSAEQKLINSDKESLTGAIDTPKEEAANRIMLQPRMGKEYVSRGGSTAYIPCHQSSVNQLMLQWRGFLPVVLATSIKAAHNQFQSSVLRASQQQHQEQIKQKKTNQPPAIFSQELASGLIPTLFVEDIIRILQKKVLRHHLVRLQTKPLPQETPYFFRLSWVPPNEVADDTASSEFCTEVFYIPDFMKTQQEHSEALYKVLSEAIPKFNEQKYIDIPSHIGIDIHKFLIKYKQYFSEL